MSAKKGFLSRLFSSKNESDCCQVTLVADEGEEDTEAETAREALVARPRDTPDKQQHR